MGMVGQMLSLALHPFPNSGRIHGSYLKLGAFGLIRPLGTLGARQKEKVNSLNE